ncbi:hypothetical protein [Anaerorhabdus sp.]|uniref:hypothetical protein n=1 Tax=Anaerorhabdus sp. TaxID=1872524 RepID=UPI002FCA22C9
MNIFKEIYDYILLVVILCYVKMFSLTMAYLIIYPIILLFIYNRVKTIYNTMIITRFNKIIIFKKYIIIQELTRILMFSIITTFFIVYKTFQLEVPIYYVFVTLITASMFSMIFLILFINKLNLLLPLVFLMVILGLGNLPIVNIEIFKVLFYPQIWSNLLCMIIYLAVYILGLVILIKIYIGKEEIL